MRALFLYFVLLPVLLKAQTPTYAWAHSVRNVGTDGQGNQCIDVSTAPDGSLYAIGISYGTEVIIDDVLLPMQGDRRYLVRFDSTGNPLWSRSPGGWAVAADGNNGVYVAGLLFQPLTFAGTTYTPSGNDAFLAKYGPDGEELWLRRMGGAGDDGAFDVAVDGLGRVHVSGFFTGTVDFGGATLTATHAQTGFHASYNAAGNLQWAALAGGYDPPEPGVYTWNALACDGEGNSYITGNFTGTGLFGTNSTSINTTQTERQYLARYDANGACIWAVVNGSATGNVGSHISLSATGGLYLCGSFKGTAASFGANNTVYNAHPNNAQIYVARYDTAGDGQWAVILTGGVFGSSASSVCTDAAGTVWVTGTAGSGSSDPEDELVDVGGFEVFDNLIFIGQLDPDGTVLNVENMVGLQSHGAHTIDAFGAHITYGSLFSYRNFDPAGMAVFGSSLLDADNGYVARYSPGFAYRWLRMAGQPGVAADATTAVALGTAGEVYSTGYFNTTAIICGDTLWAPLENTHIWLNKRAADGSCLWKRQIRCSRAGSMSQVNAALGMAVAANGDVVLCGRFFGTIDFGAVQLTSVGRADLFLARFNADGTCLWAVRGGGTGDDEGTALALTANGDIGVTGAYTGSATIAGVALTSQGATDGFVARYSGSGNSLACASFGGSAADFGSAIAVDATGNAYVAGRFTTSATFGTTTLESTALEDLFVAQYTPTNTVGWAVGSTGADHKQANGIALGAGGRLHVVGTYYASLTWGATTIMGDPAAYHPFFATLNTAGEMQWLHDLPCTDGSAQVIRVRPGGEVVVGGQFSGSLDVGTTTVTTSGTSAAWMAAFNPEGEDHWVQVMEGSTSGDAGLCSTLAVDAEQVIAGGHFGNYVFMAFFQPGSTFSFDAGSTADDLFAPNSYDAYVAKYTIPQIMAIDERGSSALLLAPNPVTRTGTVQPDAPLAPDATVRINDITGRTVHVPLLRQTERFTFDASALAPGTYLLTLEQGGMQRSVRFVKE
ncbi:MAG TPA: T9SS type A sorting domain-containing protein [Flavobacteriales bacterium]